MKLALALAAASALVVPATPALAATTPTTAPTPQLVARWTFDAGAVNGTVADTSGRGPALTTRSADQGAVRYETATPSGRFVSFPAACATTATTCPRALFETANVASLNPGTRLFRWSARVQVTKAQITGSANILQKGVAGTASQWKMQVGRTNGKAQCVVTGTGSSTVYLARSSASVADGQWHKVLCQRSGTTLSVWVDNQLGGQTTIPSTLSISNTMPLRIGGPNFKTRTDMYHGRLDDVYAELG
ncbi:laminin G domain-containing protein [Actinoplanes sp. URMC 104]|uniref:laminin G domain-containing protein n=1 Tax=Actinoplanes sp. URMC 104 TaxID=3423409 RepID=UPI003F1BCAD0